MRDRMIEIVDKAKEEYANDVTDHTETEYIVEGLLNKGAILPPCKVGDIIYALTYDRKDYMPLKVTSRESLVRWMDEDQFGNALFTTREEAEQALLKP